MHGIIFIFCKTAGEVLNKAALITLVEIDFGRKKNDKYFTNRYMQWANGKGQYRI